MKKFKSKVVVIHAMQFDGTNFNEIYRWGLSIDSDIGRIMFESRKNKTMGIKTLEGMMNANPTDWIICGTENEFYPCKHSVFKAKYEETE